MSLLFETIKCQNRQLHNLKYHDLRVRQSLNRLFEINDDFSFEDTIKIPDWIGEGLYRCRVSYAKEIEKVEFFAYEYKHPKKIQLVEDKTINYYLKFEDRSCFNNLLNSFSDVDDVIITKNNYLTDSTYANIAFFDGVKWVTSITPLLYGIKRGCLLENQMLFLDEICVKDLKFFKKIALINVMRDLDLAYNFSLQSNMIIIE
jgi:4-amino-4-deoxychorismate lyase